MIMTTGVHLNRAYMYHLTIKLSDFIDKHAKMGLKWPTKNGFWLVLVIEREVNLVHTKWVIYVKLQL